MKQKILTIDIGTQSIRAAIVTADGKVLELSQILQDVDNPHSGWAQQRSVSWWEKVIQVIKEVFFNQKIQSDSIAAISVCGQMHGPVGIDKAGNITTEWTQLWCDKRCSKQCDDIRQKYDETELAEITANPINTAWTAFKVLWIRDNQHDAYNKSRWFLTPKDFINYRLTGTAATDYSEASGFYLLDVKTEKYSSALADKLGIDIKKFPPISNSCEVIGAVTNAAAEQTGLRAGTPVIAGGGDFPVSMLGFGVVGDGLAADNTGSSSLFAIHSPRPLIHPSIQNLRHVVPGWVPFTVLDCGGLSMKWCKQMIDSAREDECTYNHLIEMAKEVQPGCEGLVFLPYMLGERRKDNTDAMGCFLGINLNHKAAHFVRAVMEGVAYAAKKDIKLFRRLGAKVESICCGGGATRNSLWNQIKADVWNRQLTIPINPEAGIRGAALLAAAGIGMMENLTAAAHKQDAKAKIVKPDNVRMEQYRLPSIEFERVYKHMIGFWNRGTV